MSQQSHYPIDRRRFLGAAIAGAGSSIAGLPAHAQAPARAKLPRKLTLKFATIAAESYPYVDGAKRWKQLLEERTEGSVEMQIFHTAQLGDERTINEGVLAGSINMGIGAGAWAGFVPSYNVVSLPFLIRDIKQMYALADGELGAKIAREAETKGFKVLAYYSAGEQHFQTRSKPIRALADFKGLKMRVIENRAIVGLGPDADSIPADLHRAAAGYGRRDGK